MNTYRMSGTISSVKEIGEYHGSTSEPLDESLLVDEYHYKTFKGAFSEKMYVQDMTDGTFTSEDVCLSSLTAVRQAEHEHLNLLRRTRLQHASQLRYNQPDIPMHHRRTQINPLFKTVGGSRPSR